MGPEAGLSLRLLQMLMKLLNNIRDAIDPRSSRKFRIRRQLHNNSQKANGENVVFLPFRINPGASWFELVLARAFRARGFSPVIGLGERAVTLADGYLISDNRIRARYLNLLRTDLYIRSFGEVPTHFDNLLGAIRMKALRTEAATAPVSLIFSYTKYDVDIGRHVASSLCRYFLKSEVRAEQEEWAAREFLFTALVSLEAAREIHHRHSPRLLISSHGIYSSWGTFCDYFRSVNCPFVTWGFQYKKNAILMSHNQSYHQDMITEDPALWQNASLTQAARADIIDYILKKGSVSHSDNIDYYNGSDRIEATVCKLLGIASRQTAFGLFPNLGWDAQISFRPKFFETMNEWLIETVRWFAGHPDLALIIRAHPAERRAAFETREKTADILARAFHTLPANIHLVAPESAISSYDVLSEVEGAIVFGSKFGLEAAIQGKPVVTAGEAYYSGKGISFDPADKADYFGLLSRLAEGLVPSAEMVEMAVRFGYHYHVRRQVILPLAEMRGAQFINYTFADETVLRPGSMDDLDHVIETCLSGAPFYALGADLCTPVNRRMTKATSRSPLTGQVKPFKGL